MLTPGVPLFSGFFFVICCMQSVAWVVQNGLWQGSPTKGLLMSYVKWYLLSIITILSTLAFACAATAQTLNVACTRSLDHEQITPDSIRIQSTKWGIDTIVTGAMLDLSRITSVEADGDVASNLVTIDVYDIQGRYLLREYNLPTSGGLHWDPALGFVVKHVIDNVCHTTPRTKSNALEIFDVGSFKLTVWRSGYVTSESMHSAEEIDAAIPVVLELLPWWKRIVAFEIVVVTPLASYERTAGTGSNKDGGSYSKDTVDRPFNFYADLDTARLTKFSYRTFVSDSLFEYETPVGPQSHAPSYSASGTVEIDPGSGIVRRIDANNYDGSEGPQNQRYSSVTLRDVALGSGDTRVYEIQMTGALADASIEDVSFDDYWFAMIGNSGYSEARTKAGPHVRNQPGVSINVKFFLQD